MKAPGSAGTRFMWVFSTKAWTGIKHANRQTPHVSNGFTLKEVSRKEYRMSWEKTELF